MAELRASRSPPGEPGGGPRLRFVGSNAHGVSWRAGGPVARAFSPPTSTTSRLSWAPLRHDEPLLLVGLGSNLLVRDGGFDGTAIFTHGALGTLRREDGRPLLRRGRRRLAQAGALRRQRRLRRGRVPRRDSRHRGRCAGDECRLPRRRDLALCGSGADAESPGRARHARAEDFAFGYRHVGLKRPPTRSSPRPGSAFRPATPTRRAAACASCWSGASPPSRWHCRTPDRCSAIRPAIMPRA
jgi:hypothetical protein